MNDTTMQKRAIAIVRVSRVRGREEEEGFASPSIQRERIAGLCDQEKLDLIETLEEMDVSGGKSLARRTGLRSAVEAVEAGRAEVIVVAYFDRLVRSLEIQANVLRRVEEAGGRVLAADIGEVSSDTTANWVNATMHGMLAEYHRRISAEKSGAAQRRAVERGIPPIKLPDGLRRVGDKIELDPVSAPVVAAAVKMRADGATVKDVRRFLAENGIDRSHNGTNTLLKSRLLIGEIVFGQNRRPEDVWRGTCPAVIDVNTWQRAQRAVPRGPRPSSDRLLARLGVLRCETCRARMVVGTQTQNGRTYPFYRCPPTGDCPERVTISAEIVERVVIDAVRAGLDGTVGIRAAQDNVRAARVALERARGEFDAAVRTLADFADEPAVVERLGELRRLRDEAHERVEALGAPDANTLLLLAEDWDRLSTEDRRQCIRATVDRVMVSPAGPGLRPPDRVEVFYHGVVERLTGKTPPLPNDLE